MRMSLVGGCCKDLFRLCWIYSGTLCDSWPEFSCQKSHKFLIILFYGFNSMPHFSMILSIFYHPRVKCGLYCFSHFLLAELSDYSIPTSEELTKWSILP
jgi:hypothetical protein